MTNFSDLYIDGQWVVGERRVPVYDPSDGSVIAARRSATSNRVAGSRGRLRRHPRILGKQVHWCRNLAAWQFESFHRSSANDGTQSASATREASRELEFSGLVG